MDYILGSKNCEYATCLSCSDPGQGGSGPGLADLAAALPGWLWDNKGTLIPLGCGLVAFFASGGTLAAQAALVCSSFFAAHSIAKGVYAGQFKTATGGICFFVADTTKGKLSFIGKGANACGWILDSDEGRKLLKDLRKRVKVEFYKKNGKRCARNAIRCT